jgi:hypothetical protein
MEGIKALGNDTFFIVIRPNLGWIDDYQPGQFWFG